MFYNKYYPNNYEELISYYPKFYREVFEMRAILEAEGSLADDMEDNIERVFDNSAYNLMASLVRDCKLTEKQKKEIRDILDGIKD